MDLVSRFVSPTYLMKITESNVESIAGKYKDIILRYKVVMNHGMKFILDNTFDLTFKGFLSLL